MPKAPFRISIGFAIALLALTTYGGDSSVIDTARIDYSTQLTPSTRLRILNLRLPLRYQPRRVDSFGSLSFVSEPVAFRLPVNTVSFQLFLRGDDADIACFAQVINPGNVDLLGVGERGFLDGDTDYCGALVPQGPQFAAKGGLWRYRVNGFGAIPRRIRVTLALRTGFLPANGSTVQVQPFLASGTFSTADVQPALDEMRRIYERAGTTLRIANTIVLTEPAFRLVNPDFTDPVTAQLVSQGRAGKANLFFVEDSSSLAEPLLGISAGLPGSLGIAGNRNGVLIGLNNHLVINDQLDSKLLGETAGHEMGHFLGLFHTSEFGPLRIGDEHLHDILADTPECDVAVRDLNGDGQVAPRECKGLGAANLMFWTSAPGLRQTIITPGQAHVIHFSPIAGIY